MRTERTRVDDNPQPSPLVLELRDMAKRLNDLAEQLESEHGLDDNDG